MTAFLCQLGIMGTTQLWKWIFCRVRYLRVLAWTLDADMS